MNLRQLKDYYNNKPVSDWLHVLIVESKSLFKDKNIQN
jgi:hypothetical protein